MGLGSSEKYIPFGIIDHGPSSAVSTAFFQWMLVTGYFLVQRLIIGVSMIELRLLPGTGVKDDWRHAVTLLFLGLYSMKSGPHRSRQRCSGPVGDRRSSSWPVLSRQNRLSSGATPLISIVDSRYLCSVLFCVFPAWTLLSVWLPVHRAVSVRGRSLRSCLRPLSIASYCLIRFWSPSEWTVHPCHHVSTLASRETVTESCLSSLERSM